MSVANAGLLEAAAHARLVCSGLPNATLSMALGQKPIRAPCSMLSRYRVGRFADSVHAGEAVEDDGTTLGPRPPICGYKASARKLQFSP